MNGNFCTVVTMIFLPRRRKVRSSRRSPSDQDRGHVVVGLDGAVQLRVQRAPVGDDDDGIELRLVASAAVFSSTSWCASQAMVLLLPLPAECWIR